MSYQNLETVEELCDRLKVKKSWVYRQTMRKDEGALPKVTLGKYIRFVPEEVDRWIAQKQED